MQKTTKDKQTIEDVSLGRDTEYYRYIFKKTEKIVCAVFYTLHKKVIGTKDTIVTDTEVAAQQLLEYVLKSLRVPKERARGYAEEITFRYLELESKLKILRAAQYLSADILHVFVSEIDSVVRMLKKYTVETEIHPLLIDSEGDEPAVQREATGRSERPLRHTAEHRARPAAGGATAVKGDRRTRILELLREKGQSSIKDISESISDCSEKTIQRELNSLIESGQVVREGERRWSKYSVTNTHGV